MEQDDRRNKVAPVPDDQLSFMNDEQKMAYRSMERFGWPIKFIRRPLFTRPVCVLSNPEGNKLAVLEEDGTINEDSDIPMRE